jgi:hypothetical protein
MWRKENRTELSVDKFVSMFPSCREAHRTNVITNLDLQYLGDILSSPKLTIEIKGGYETFFKAYTGDNYCENHTDDSLHNSCMREADKANKCADFYENFAGTKILTVTDEMGAIYARAIIWEGVTIGKEKVTLMDRVYYANRGILSLIYKYAAEQGFIRKEINSYDSRTQFCRFKDNTWQNFSDVATLKVPVNQWHKGGAPYMDTMTYLLYDGNDLMLSNTNDISSTFYMAKMQSTDTIASLQSYRICPVCGKAHTQSSKICSKCSSEVGTYEGILVAKECIDVNGEQVPVIFLEEDKKTLKKWVKLNSHLE